VYGVYLVVYTVNMENGSAARRIALASRRLLDKYGAEAVTMRRVAKAVGITPMAIYRHYQDRAALLNALANEGFRELAARLASSDSMGDTGERLTKMGEIFLDHGLENPRLFELMFLRPRAGARRFPADFKAGQSPTANFMAEVVREGMDSGYFRRDNVWEIVLEMGALSHGLILLYLGGRVGVSRSRFRSLYRRSFRRYINGIRE
jgi:AcrR family transcriptional regulator